MSIKKAYNTWSEIYDSNENKTRDLDYIATTSSLSKIRFEKVLELGCGTGKNTTWLEKNAQQVLAVDFSEGMLKKAKEKIKSSKVTFIQADLNEEWHFSDAKFNLLTCNLVLEHIENLDFIFNQAYKKLKKGGIFFICELHPFKQYLGTKARFETENGTEELEVYTHHITDFTKNAAKNGFEIIEINEWFDELDIDNLPRLISFILKKKTYLIVNDINH